MNIFIMGAPGSGKGTFSERIQEAFNLHHISTGDIFRENIKNQTELGKAAEAYISQGKLVPDEITDPMVADYLKNIQDGNGYLLDGYPRTLEQAETFEKATAGTDEAVDVVVVMDVPFDVLTKRITGRRTCKKCGAIYNIYTKAPAKEDICDVCGSPLSVRKDDNAESLAVRLDEYSRNTEPVIAFYEDKGIVARINADRPFEEIWPDIEQSLKTK